MTIAQLIYVSRPSPTITLNDVQDILEAARDKNAARGITGFMLYRQDRFIQLLEGPALAVTGLFATIHSDPRHEDVVLVGCNPVLKRTFENWSMGYLPLTQEAGRILHRHTGCDLFETKEFTFKVLLRLMTVLAGGHELTACEGRVLGVRQRT